MKRPSCRQRRCAAKSELCCCCRNQYVQCALAAQLLSLRWLPAAPWALLLRASARAAAFVVLLGAYGTSRDSGRSYAALALLNHTNMDVSFKFLGFDYSVGAHEMHHRNPNRVGHEAGDKRAEDHNILD